ncbi:hypothetical protein D9M68_610450 [compost metagenome]
MLSAPPSDNCRPIAVVEEQWVEPQILRIADVSACPPKRPLQAKAEFRLAQLVLPWIIGYRFKNNSAEPKKDRNNAISVGTLTQSTRAA